MKYICFLLCLYSSVSSCKEATTNTVTVITEPKIERANNELVALDSAIDNSTSIAELEKDIKPEPIAKPKNEQEPVTQPTVEKPKASELINTPEPQPTPTPVVEVPKPEGINIEKSENNIEESTETNVAPDEPSTSSEKDGELSHQELDALLAQYVRSTGKVNYAGIKVDLAKLESYLTKLEGVAVATLSTKEQLAFWINAYNAYTIKLIIDNYPVSSITDLEGGKPWDKKWIKLNGQVLSLNNIENDIIRPQLNEPRIHFAVNCAAKSCPSLLNQAWTADNLEANFEKQTKAFVNNATYNVITSSQATVSKIFEWYAVDFGDLASFLNKYSATKLDAGTSIIFKEYDWALNN